MKKFFLHLLHFSLQNKKAKRRKINSPYISKIVAQSHDDINIEVLTKFYGNGNKDTHSISEKIKSLICFSYN